MTRAAHFTATRSNPASLLALLVLCACSGIDAVSPSGQGQSSSSGSSGGGGGTSQTTGSLSVWTDFSQQIAVKVDGNSAGTLTQYFPSGTPNCGQAGTLTVTLAAGAHAVTAASGATTWNGQATIGAGGCFLYKLSAPAGGGGTGGGGSSDTGARFTLCVANVQNFDNSQWNPMPGQLNGLDAKVYYSTTYSTADVVFRNRFTNTIHFDEVVYRGPVSPPPTTKYRHDLSAGRAENGPGPNLGVNAGIGSTACVVVDRIRFGTDSGPYWTP